MVRKNWGLELKCSVSLDYLALCTCSLRVTFLFSVSELQLCSGKVVRMDKEWPEYSIHSFFGSLALQGEQSCLWFQAMNFGQVLVLILITQNVLTSCSSSKTTATRCP